MRPALPVMTDKGHRCQVSTKQAGMPDRTFQPFIPHCIWIARLRILRTKCYVATYGGSRDKSLKIFCWLEPFAWIVFLVFPSCCLVSLENQCSECHLSETIGEDKGENDVVEVIQGFAILCNDRRHMLQSYLLLSSLLKRTSRPFTRTNLFTPVDCLKR